MFAVWTSATSQLLLSLMQSDLLISRSAETPHKPLIMATTLINYLVARCSAWDHPRSVGVEVFGELVEWKLPKDLSV